MELLLVIPIVVVALSWGVYLLLLRRRKRKASEPSITCEVTVDTSAALAALAEFRKSLRQ